MKITLKFPKQGEPRVVVDNHLWPIGFALWRSMSIISSAMVFRLRRLAIAG